MARPRWYFVKPCSWTTWSKCVQDQRSNAAVLVRETSVAANRGSCGGLCDCEAGWGGKPKQIVLLCGENRNWSQGETTVNDVACPGSSLIGGLASHCRDWPPSSQPSLPKESSGRLLPSRSYQRFPRGDASFA